MISSTGPLTFRTHLIQSADCTRCTHVDPHHTRLRPEKYAIERPSRSFFPITPFSGFLICVLWSSLHKTFLRRRTKLQYIPRTRDSLLPSDWFPPLGNFRRTAS